MRLRDLWDRITGEEARHAWDWTAEHLAARYRDRDNHRREIEQIQHVALDAGVLLYREYDQVDITEAGGPVRHVNGAYRWCARPLSEDGRLGARFPPGSPHSGDSAKEDGDGDS